MWINPNYSVTHSYRSAGSIKIKANSQCINLFLTCLNYHFQTTYKEKPDENGRVVFEFPELVTEKITVKIIKKKKNVEVTITDFTVKACLPGKKKERSYYICNTFQYFLSDWFLFKCNFVEQRRAYETSFECACGKALLKAAMHIGLRSNYHGWLHIGKNQPVAFGSVSK